MVLGVLQVRGSAVQTLGISDSTPATESRLKSLFWPSIKNGTDVDYLGAQGYWVCAIVAVGSFVVAIAFGQPIMGVLLLLFYYVGGVGVRERSLYAAAMVFGLYFVDLLFAISRVGPGAGGVVRIIFAALLLSNLRGTWIASQWKPGSEEAELPPRFAETWKDKFADKFPSWFWPKVRIVYYVFSFCMFALISLGAAAVILRPDLIEQR